MEKIEFILEGDVAIKRMNYNNGKSIVIYKINGFSDYYGINRKKKKVLLGRYNHKTHILDINTQYCNPKDSTLRACIMEFLLKGK